MENQNHDEVIEQISKNTREAITQKRADEMKKREEMENVEVSSGVKKWVEDEASGRNKGKQV